jgi:transporter family-2 protein
LNNPVIPLSGSRYAAVALLAVALCLIYRSNVRPGARRS